MREFLADFERIMADWLAERKRQAFQAVLLDQDGQELSTGLAIVEDQGLVGVFWPLSKWPEDKSPSTATILLKSSGDRIAIHSAYQCMCDFGPMHLHFRCC